MIQFITTILISLYAFQVGIVIGYNLDDFKDNFIINTLYSLFAIPIIIFYFIVALLDKIYKSDIAFFIRILLFGICESKLKILRQKGSVFLINDKTLSKGKIYNYLANKVIKKYDL